jgi:hypothetical protein
VITKGRGEYYEGKINVDERESCINDTFWHQGVAFPSYGRREDLSNL